jgi:hypothetical protein
VGLLVGTRRLTGRAKRVWWMDMADQGCSILAGGAHSGAHSEGDSGGWNNAGSAALLITGV